MKPSAREKIILVILFLSLCAVRFFNTSCFMLYFSKQSNTWVRVTSNKRCRLNERSVSPKSIPNKIMKKMRKISLKFIESIERGRK